MAIDPQTSFVHTDGAEYPDNAAVNASGGTALDGTEFVKKMIDTYMFGRQQALLNYAGLTPNGITESDGASQELEALKKGFGIGPGIGVTYWKNGDPATNGDRVLLFQGQGIVRANYEDLDNAVYVGDGNNPTAASFYHADDAAGTTRNTTGIYLILPDNRGLGQKNIGDATVNGRVKVGPVELGEVQEDQSQGWQSIVVVDGVSSFGYVRMAGVNGIASSSGYQGVSYSIGSSKQGDTTMVKAGNDGTNGDIRKGLNARDSALGTNFGITY